MARAEGFFFNGLVALTLSLVLWRLTHSEIGWLLLWTPGTMLVAYGWFLILTD
jgi:hypothetical protein